MNLTQQLNIEMNQFQTKLQRQSDAFGLLTGATRLQSPRAYDPELQGYYARRSATIRSKFLAELVSRMAAACRALWTKSVSVISSYYRKRSDYQNILKLSDYYLQDIGVSREELLHGLRSGLPLSNVFSSSRGNDLSDKTEIIRTEGRVQKMPLGTDFQVCANECLESAA